LKKKIFSEKYIILSDSNNLNEEIDFVLEDKNFYNDYLEQINEYLNKDNIIKDICNLKNKIMIEWKEYYIWFLLTKYIYDYILFNNNIKYENNLLNLLWIIKENIDNWIYCNSNETDKIKEIDFKALLNENLKEKNKVNILKEKINKLYKILWWFKNYRLLKFLLRITIKNEIRDKKLIEWIKFIKFQDLKNKNKYLFLLKYKN